ncbi:hypothetical protein [Clostridium cibarium]|uniref:O-antigen ligase n=1 Tax=Clostridium cibarium TaxID=2762247 RepID=A0ABR8PUC1_9CLOT|nr:hypothetical protein [Clostridium cibarium]MBD7911778.1 hypothetical protein [Clostridium cibarium]
MLSLLWICLIAVVSLKNTDNIYKLYLILILSVPFNEKIYEKIGLSLFGISLTNILLILLLLLSLRQIVKNKAVPFAKYDFLTIFFVILIIIYMYIGYKNQNIFLKSDIKTFMLIIITYFVFRVDIYFKNNGGGYVRIVIYSIIIYSITTIIIYIFRDKILPLIYNDNLLLWWESSRVAFSNGCLSLLLPLIFSAKKSIVKNRIKIIAVISSIASAIISQSRALILMYLTLLILAFIINSARKNVIVIFSLALSCFMIISTAIMFNGEVMSYASSSNNVIVNRFVQLLNKEYKENNVRSRTNYECLNEIRESGYLGFGLGKEMVLYNVDSSIASTSMFIDNGIYTIMGKMGIFAIIPIVVFIITIIVSLIKSGNINNYTKLLLLSTIISFVFTTGIINAQIIYSTPISTITIISIVLFQRKV